MFSQFGEDEYMLTGFPKAFRGYAAEIGAYNGTDRSNTLLLEQLGWKVLCVEANPEFTDALSKSRNLVRMCAVADYNGESNFKVYRRNPEAMSALKPVLTHPVWKVELSSAWDSYSVPVRTLDSLLEEVAFPRLDALSIDVEGGELDVIKGCDLNRWKPRFVVAEDWDQSPKLLMLMESFGYQVDRRMGVNTCFFKPTQLAESIHEDSQT